MMKALRVLVVEDEPAIAELIAIHLKHSNMIPVLAADAQAACQAIEQAVPDVILLDWMLPGGSGLLLARQWRQMPSTQLIPLLMLTARSDERDKIAGLEAGADDYITKPFSPQELIARIRAVLRRRSPEYASSRITHGALQLDDALHQVTYRGQAIKLGLTEFRLLSYLMHYAQRVHSRAKLLENVWGSQTLIEERTVDVHIKRLREALGSAGVMVQTVRGLGYRFCVASET